MARKKRAWPRPELRAELEAAVEAAGRVPDRELWLDSPPSLAFHDFIIHQYAPPKDKRFLVFFQCSVRRPFSTATSQASMRRAVSVATGADPAKDFGECPVHVVVLASKIGPAPYEFEEVYPANVRSGGVKHFDGYVYKQAKPIIARRMADYIVTHGGNYEHMAAFAEGRYRGVMRAACKMADTEFPIFPIKGGMRVTRMGRHPPRPYWGKYWIQLFFEIRSWLGPAEQTEADKRLDSLDMEYDNA